MHPSFLQKRNIRAVSYEWKKDQLALEILKRDENKNYFFELDLPGLYQRKNLCTVLASLDVLNQYGFTISHQQISCALKKVKQTTGLHGRWEVIHQNPQVVLEVAHNKDGIEQMLQHLQNISYRQLHFVLGMVKDKDITTILQLLPKEATYYFTQAHIPRALPAVELQQKAEAFSLKGSFFDDVNTALQEAVHKAAADDLIIVCGSIFLVAEVDKASIVQLS